MSTLAWLSGRRADMERQLSAALEVLEVQPPGPDLAMAYSDLAVRIGLYGGQREEAERAVADAVALAAAVHDPAVLDYVHVRVGLVHAALFADDSPLRRSLDRARQDGHHLEAGMAYQGLAWDAVLRRDWTTARRWIGEGVEYLEPREILGPLRYLRGLQATTELAAGDWTAAEATARWVLAQQGGQGITGVHASATLARLHVRRGDTEKATSTVQELWEVAETCGLLHHIAPAASALAEHAELTGGWAAAVPPLRSTRALAGRLRHVAGRRRGRLLVVPGGRPRSGRARRGSRRGRSLRAARDGGLARRRRDGGSSWDARSNERPRSPTPTTRRRCSPP